MKKKIVLAVLIATLLTGCGKTIPKLENGTEAVVTFNDGTMISVDDLYNKMKDSASTTLMQMIDKKILEEAYEDKLTDADAYAKNQIEALKQYYGLDENGNYSETQFLSVIQQATSYTTIEAYQDDIRTNYLQRFAIEDYVKSIIKDSEIEKYYKDEIVGDRDVYHIQIVPEVKSTMTDSEKTEAENDALEKAKAIITRLKKGESFEDIAKEESDDEATAENGGSLGFINKGYYGSDEFDKEAFSLKVGEFSNTPVKTTAGYEIIYIKEEKDKEDLEDIRDDIIDALVEEKLAEDATLQITAIIELRKSNGVDVIDTEIDRAIEKYMDALMTNAKNSSTTN